MPSRQSRRTSCSPTPSISIAAITQWINVSSPRDSHFGFGQRCIASPSGLTICALQSGQRSGMRNGRSDDLRDHVTRALDDDVVADAEVLAIDVGFVVQRRLGNRDAADLDRLELRPRVERSRAADADVNLDELRL